MSDTKKINVDKTMDEIVSLTNQIAGLNMLLSSKKQTMAEYFKKSGETSLSNDECTVFVQTKTTIDYDVEKILSEVDKDLTDEFIERTRTIVNWEQFVKMLKSHGIKSADIKPFIFVKKEINNKKLSELYEHGEITLEDLEGCYEAKVTKSVALRMKNAKREITLT